MYELTDELYWRIHKVFVKFGLHRFTFEFPTWTGVDHKKITKKIVTSCGREIHSIFESLIRSLQKEEVDGCRLGGRP